MCADTAVDFAAGIRALKPQCIRRVFRLDLGRNRSAPTVGRSVSQINGMHRSSPSVRDRRYFVFKAISSWINPHPRRVNESRRDVHSAALTRRRFFGRAFAGASGERLRTVSVMGTYRRFQTHCSLATIASCGQHSLRHGAAKLRSRRRNRICSTPEHQRSQCIGGEANLKSLSIAFSVE